LILYATPQESSMHSINAPTFTEMQAIDIANKMIGGQYEVFKEIIRTYFPAQELLEKEAAVEVKAPAQIDVKSDLFEYIASDDEEDVQKVKTKAKATKYK